MMEQIWDLILSGSSKAELILLLVLVVVWGSYLKLLDDLRAELHKRHEQVERLMREYECRQDEERKGKRH